VWRELQACATERNAPLEISPLTIFHARYHWGGEPLAGSMISIACSPTGTEARQRHRQDRNPPKMVPVRCHHDPAMLWCHGRNQHIRQGQPVATLAPLCEAGTRASRPAGLQSPQDFIARNDGKSEVTKGGERA
jgi:hypothetical protein